MKNLVIAIDGYSSCGKSTTAKAVASTLHYAYLDTGAMYRGVTLYLLENNIAFDDMERIEHALRHDIHISFKRNGKTGRNELCLNDAIREDDIRQMRISNSVSEVSVIVQVRHAMVAQQQRMGRKRGVVMDIRARRRQDELAAKGEHVELDEIIENLRKRDHIDSTRAESPLRRASDAVLLDTTHITITEQVDFVLDKVSSALFAAYANKQLHG
jgi:cytidylate kinase